MLNVSSRIISQDEGCHEIFIEGFMQVVEEFWMADNINDYFFIVTNESKEEIMSLPAIFSKKSKNPRFDFREHISFICQSDEQKQWVSSLDFKVAECSRPPKKNLLYKKIEASQVGWRFKGYTLIHYFFVSQKLRIFHIEGLDHHWEILPYFDAHMDYIFVTIPNNFTRWNFEFAAAALKSQNPDIPLDHIIWFSPNMDAHLFSLEFGFRSIILNQNTFLESDVFGGGGSHDIAHKKYDMVMNCRPEKWKRPELASLVSNLAYIEGRCFDKLQYVSPDVLRPKFKNNRRLAIEEVAEVYNESICGGIFSAGEGACFSSSEYLLSGLPVVSTKSRGGRDIWYDEFNSVIVDADPESVKRGVDECITKVRSGVFNGKKIRERHIALAEEMKKRFVAEINRLFKVYDIGHDADTYIQKHYIPKMRTNVPVENVIAFLSETAD